MFDERISSELRIHSGAKKWEESCRSCRTSTSSVQQYSCLTKQKNHATLRNVHGRGTKKEGRESSVCNFCLVVAFCFLSALSSQLSALPLSFTPLSILSHPIPSSTTPTQRIIYNTSLASTTLMAVGFWTSFLYCITCALSAPKVLEYSGTSVVIICNSKLEAIGVY